jgi:hypothetical protein
MLGVEESLFPPSSSHLILMFTVCTNPVHLEIRKLRLREAKVDGQGFSAGERAVHSLFP